MTEPRELWVVFGGVRADVPFVPVWWVPAATFEEAVKLRDRDGAPANVITPYGTLVMRRRWLACLDHVPAEAESGELIKAMAEEDESE